MSDVDSTYALAINLALCQHIAVDEVRLWPETTCGVGFQAIFHDE